VGSISFQWKELWGLSDAIRSRLPWQWQPLVTDWLVWSIILLVASLVFFALHFYNREKPKVDWLFLKTGHPLALGWSRTGAGVATYKIGGVQFTGENISGHPFHQVYGEITLHRDNRKLPLLILAEGGMVPTEDVDTVPPRALLTLGAIFRADTSHWDGFEREMTPEEFLQNFGGFTVEIFIDGARQSWSFSIDQLREAIEAYKRAEDDRWIAGNRPQVYRKNPSAGAR
jgi:hypothetical protein